MINEPDERWAFAGSPQQYAAMLSSAYRAIHLANPSARVAFGGIARVGLSAWMNQVLDAPGTDVRHKFDIANLHVRGRAAQTGNVVCRWRRYFANRGFRGSLWVTETGYSAYAKYQTDPAFHGGLGAQAAYVAAAIPNMISAGASKVFVAERDDGTGRFGTEGILQSPNPLPADPAIVRRPAFYAVRKLTKRRRVQSLRTTWCPIG